MTTERAHARLCPEAHRSEQHEAGAAASYDGATRFVYLAHIHIHLFDTHERRLENPVLSVSLVCAVAIWHLAHKKKRESLLSLMCGPVKLDLVL